MKKTIALLRQLQSLDVSLISLACDEFLSAFADQLQLLTRRSDARLSSCSICSPFGQRPRDVVHIVSALKGLRRVKLHNLKEDCIDEEVDALVQQNPDLEVLHLERMRVSSASLTSISHLTHLQELVIAGEGRGSSNFSLEAILQVLRGPSRHVLRLIELFCAPSDLEAVAQEVDLMHYERRGMSGRSQESLTFDLPKGVSSHFSIRASRI